VTRLTSWLLATLICTLSAQAAAADGLESRDDLLQQTSMFMDTVAKGDIQAAYRHLRPHLGVDNQPYDQSAKDAAGYFSQVKEQAGKTLNTSQVRTEVIANDFTRISWLQKFRSAAIAWEFTFYRPDADGWKLVGVSYSTDIEYLYEPAP
jgi:TnpA family transposase